jgi:transcriptional regulator with GAF, ATPase, and Fis domain
MVTGGAEKLEAPTVADVTDPFDRHSPAGAPDTETFQRLMADAAFTLVGTESLHLDAVINKHLRQIAGVLRLDRVCVWHWTARDSVVATTHSWPAEPLPASLRLASAPYTFSKLSAGEAVSFTNVEDLPHAVDRDTYRQYGLRCAAALPMTRGSEADAIWALHASSRENGPWWPPMVERLRLVASVIGQALARRGSQIALQNALDRQPRPAARLPHLRQEIPRHQSLTGAAGQIVSESLAIRAALGQVRQVALTPATVLLRGETGAGKEAFAQAIHDLSPRHHRPMIKVSCAAIPTALFESELFGRERGAYTGAVSRQIGRIEAAHQSTLFLDEIGDLPMEMQVKLLRVLQERVIERLGSTQPIKVDVRIITATHRDLEKAVHDGSFREDLFYRLNVFPVAVPPLRERREDIPGLAWAFVDEFSRAFGKTITSIAPASLHAMGRYDWPGNVRELRNVIERAMILAADEQLEVSTPQISCSSLNRTGQTLAAVELAHIVSTLANTNWRVRGRDGAADRLGLKPSTLESRMTKLGIVRPNRHGSHGLATSPSSS